MGWLCAKGRGSYKDCEVCKFNEIDLNKDGEIDALEAGKIKSQIEGARKELI